MPQGACTLLQPLPAPMDPRVAGTTRTACRTQQSVDMGAVTAPRQGHHPPCTLVPRFPSQCAPRTQCYHPQFLHSSSALPAPWCPQTPAHQLHQPLPVPKQQCPLDLFLAQGRQEVEGRQGPKSSRQEGAEAGAQQTSEAQGPKGHSWIAGVPRETPALLWAGTSPEAHWGLGGTH